MAQQPDINLGTVGFGLEANTESLERSLALLSRFGERVNTWSARTDEAGAAVARRMQMLERSMTGVFNTASAAAEKARGLGNVRMSDTLQRDAERVIQTLGRIGPALQPQQLNRAMQGIKASTDQTNQSLKNMVDEARRAERQMEALSAAQRRVSSFISTASLRGAPPDIARGATDSLNAYRTALGTGTASAEVFGQAQRKLKDDLNQLNIQMREHIALMSRTSAQQQNINRQTRNVGAVNLAAQRVGVDPSYVAMNQAALRQYSSAIGGGDTRQQVASLHALQSSLARTRSAIKEAEDAGSKLSIVFKDIARASILVAGPLSGVGSRLAVMSALFETTTAKVAVMVAGLSAVGLGAYKLGEAAVRTAMDMERFNALFTVSSGSAALAADEYEYVLGQANKLGQSIQGLVAPYANFATAARLSEFSLEEQRKVFESVMVTGAALRFDTQRTERTFLALEQMVSKGTVQMQELKLQLGQAIPGAMELAAIAMGKTSAELNKMLKDGDVLAKDFLLKLAPVLIDTFGGGALEGARSLQAELNRLNTATFEFSRKLNEATQVSEAFRTIVVAITQAINYLGNNVETVIQTVVALGAAFAAYFIAGGIVAGVVAVTGAFITLGKAIAGVTLAAGVMGGAISMVVRLGLALTAGAAAYKYFEESNSAVVKSGQEFITKSQSWVDQVNTIGWAHDRVAKQMKEATESRLKAVQAEIQAIQLQIQAETKLHQAKLQKSQAEPGIVNKTLGKLGEMFLPKALQERIKTVETGDSPALIQGKKQLAEMQKLEADLQGLSTKIGGMTLKKFDLGGPIDKADKKKKSTKDEMAEFNNFVKDMEKQIGRTQQLSDELAAIPLGRDAVNMSEAILKADEAMAKLTDVKKIGDLTPLRNQLEKAGFAGANLKEQFVAMFFAMEQGRDKISDLNKFLSEYENLAKESGKFTEELRSSIRGLESEMAAQNPEQARSIARRQKALDEYRRQLQAMKISPEGIESQVSDAAALYDRNEQLKKQADHIADVRTSYERLSDTMGDKVHKAWFDYYKDIEKVKEALRLGIASQAEAATIQEQLGKDLYAKLFEHADVWVKKTQEVIHNLEDTAAEAFAEIAMTGKFEFGTMLQQLEKELLTFGFKVLVMKPLFQSLFGDLYSGGGKGGMGEGGTGNFGMIGNIGKEILGGMGIKFPGAFSAADMASGAAAPVVEGAWSMIDVPYGHTGMRVGSYAPVARLLPSAIFEGARRYHSGTGLKGILGPNEVPIIAEKGEQIIPKGQRRQGGSSVNVSMTVVTPDANSFRMSEGQIMAQMKARMNAAWRNT
jgi:tape measure domain-containing protein